MGPPEEEEEEEADGRSEAEDEVVLVNRDWGLNGALRFRSSDAFETLPVTLCVCIACLSSGKRDAVFSCSVPGKVFSFSICT